MSLFAIVLLVAAAALLVAAEWTRLEKIGDARAKRLRARRKARFRVIQNQSEHDDDDFARSVERDLAALPTIDEHEPRR